MFNQINIQLKPSKKIAFILSTIGIAVFLLLTMTKLPILWYFLLSLALFASFTYISLLLAFLLRPESIVSLELQASDCFATSKDGTRFKIHIDNNAFIYPSFCLLSFACELPEKPYSHKKTDQGIFKQIADYFNSLFQNQTRRHMLICRYNVTNLDAFRRLRVYLKLTLAS